MKRFFEILPGGLAWLTLLLLFFFSWQAPFGVVIFVILFDLYWLLKIFYLFLHLRHSFVGLTSNLRIDWQSKLEKEFPEQWPALRHLVIMPMYREPYSVIQSSLGSLLAANYPKEKMMIVLATEARGGAEDQMVAASAVEDFGSHFGSFSITVHPTNLPGEIPGKGSNETWAIKKVKEDIIDKLGFDYDNILVSVFDADSRPGSQYFNVLSCKFLSAPNRQHASYQPIPVFTNNFREVSPFARIVAFSSTFWQLMQQARPKRLVSFSSHSLPFRALVEGGFWPIDIVSEDSQVFYRLMNHYGGDWRAVPLLYPVYMDAVSGRNLWEALKNIYKQQRRWAWGVENSVYVLSHFWQNTKFKFHQKLFWSFVTLEGSYSWATGSLTIFLFSWVPNVIGGEVFRETLASYNLSDITSFLMNFSMLGVVTSAFLSLNMILRQAEWVKRKHYPLLVLQWFLLPVTFIFLSSLPALEAQTRMMLGGKMRLGFWRTPKS
ncbi:MAG: glycosyltransferase family 2 protein [bacterium]|nr:glycosyltransferase family 2 protein [bacterium]